MLPTLTILLGLLLQDASRPAAAPAASADELRKIVERIATGDEETADLATDGLIQRIADPLSDAIGNLSDRPPEQQKRLRLALARLTSGLRARMYRADLKEADRKLFDAFQKRDPELVRDLFDDDPQKRIDAVGRIPLEPDSAAGVLLISRINGDWDADVVDEALNQAAALKDGAIVRGLTEFVTGATAEVKGSDSGQLANELAIVLGGYTSRAIRIVGDAKARDAVPAIVDALRFWGHSPFRGPDFFDIAAVAEALGKIGDERAAPVLIEFLNEPRARSVRPQEQGKAVTQTDGDAMLLALLRIYSIKPETLGFLPIPQGEPTYGFSDENARTAAVKEFLRWYQENGSKPAAQRGPVTTQPAKPVPPPP